MVTTATLFRQVRNQLWPHIRKTQARAVLPGNCLQTEWWMPDQYGVDTQVAYGFTVPEHDEAAMQGINAAKLLLIVDEAGGIARGPGAPQRPSGPGCRRETQIACRPGWARRPRSEFRTWTVVPAAQWWR